MSSKSKRNSTKSVSSNEEKVVVNGKKNLNGKIPSEQSAKKSTTEISSRHMRIPPRKRAKNQSDAADDVQSAKRRRINGEPGNATIIPVRTIPIEERTIYHMQSMESFTIKDHDLNDSGDDSDYKLVEQHIQERKINNLRDLNDGEKEMMNLWNAFMSNHNFVGICNMRQICETFIQLHFMDIVKRKLYRNFLLHFCVLFDNGALTSNEYMLLVQQIQKHMGITTFDGLTAQLQQQLEPQKRTSVPKKKVSKTTSVVATLESMNKRYTLRSVDAVSKG